MFVEQPEIVFSVEEESSSGGTSYCCVEHRPDGYHFLGNEMGHIGGPFETALAALSCDGWEFGMEYMTITSSLPYDEFRKALANVLMENVTRLTVNSVELENPTIEDVMAAYPKV